MAVLIKGASLPQDCKDCFCSYWTEGAHHDYCQAIGYETEIVWEGKARPNWCPLVSIPERPNIDDTLLEEAGFEL